MPTPTGVIDTNGRSQPDLLTPGKTQLGYFQGGTQQTDANGNPYAPAVVQLASATTNPVTVAGSLPAIVQKSGNVSTGSVASLAQPFSGVNSQGNSIVVVCGVGNGTAPTVADSLGNTYTQATIGKNSTTFETAIFYATNIQAGANTVTVTNAGTAASMALEIYEVSGLIAQSMALLDQTSAANGTGTAATASNITPASPNELAFAGVAIGTAAQTITPGSGWANDSGQQNPTTPSGLFSFVSISQFLGSLAAVTPTATFTSEPFAIAVASFRPVMLGVEGTVALGGYQYTHMTTATTTQIKTGPGILHAICVNTLVGSATIEFDDQTSHAAPVMGILTLPSTITGVDPFQVHYDCTFNTGLSITTSGATDLTIIWK